MGGGAYGSKLEPTLPKDKVSSTKPLRRYDEKVTNRLNTPILQTVFDFKN